MSFIRKAVLIGAPGFDSQSPTYLKGVEIDLDNYKFFLRSALGGNWQDEEIEVIYKPSTKDEVIKAIDAIRADYAFIVFCGHGFINTQNNSTYVNISEKDFISVSELDALCDRQTTVIDSCRGFYFPEDKRLLLENLFFKAKMIDTSKIFADAILSAEQGTIILYSTGENQSAGENLQGGLFTQCLLTSIKDWANNNPVEKLMNVYDAFTLACNHIKEFSKKQKPEISVGRRKYFFPIAINPNL